MNRYILFVCFDSADFVAKTRTHEIAKLFIRNMRKARIHASDFIFREGGGAKKPQICKT